jgi:hypothetical protein
MMITPYVRGVALNRAQDMRVEARRARRIAAAWAARRSERRWTWYTP